MADDDEGDVVVGLATGEAVLQQVLGDGLRVEARRLAATRVRSRSTETSMASPRSSMSPSV